MCITTQSDEPPRGAFRSEFMVARAIRDGRSKGAMLPIVYEFPGDLVHDRVNPPA
jgi:phage terminase large subunit-like protein